ncbi:unnamed protein product, partial [Tenebrio molitor]
MRINTVWTISLRSKIWGSKRFYFGAFFKFLFIYSHISF